MKMEKTNVYDVVVVGGGPSGMMAAICAGRNKKKVLLLEANDSLGKKLCATGNGKCNFTNLNMNATFFYGANSSFVNTVLQGFSSVDTIAFFEGLGMYSTEKNGMLYPRSQQATTVLRVLKNEIERLGIHVMTEKKISGLRIKDECFVVSCQKELFIGHKVIMALGGASSNVKGSNGDGYYYAEQLGHHSVPRVPALVQLHTDDIVLQKAAGVRCDAKVSLYVDGTFCKEDPGELQITDYGISGICVFQLSRIAAYALSDKQDVNIKIDFVNEIEENDLSEILMSYKEAPNNKDSVFMALCGLLHEKLANVLLENLSIQRDCKMVDLSEKDIKNLCHKMKHYEVHITDTHGMKHAQTCAGGICSDEIDPKSMESKLVPGLYFVGEIIDVDGICGGYNLQWAWSSGAIAGMHASEEKK